MKTIINKSELAHLAYICARDVLDHYKSTRGYDEAFEKLELYYPKVLECQSLSPLTSECEEILSQTYAAFLDFISLLDKPQLEQLSSFLKN